MGFKEYWKGFDEEYLLFGCKNDLLGDTKPL